MRFKVQNMSPRKGKEVVQLYMRGPYGGEHAKIKHLLVFKKILLDAHEQGVVEFFIDDKQLERWNSEGKATVFHTGEYQFLVGSSSKDLRLYQSLLCKKN